MNNYVLNKRNGKLDPSQPVKIGHPSSTYSVASNPNITSSPQKRRLGDIIMVNDIQQILEDTFDYKNQRCFLQLFFNHPYKSLLHNYFDLPIEDDSTIPSIRTNSIIHWT